MGMFAVKNNKGEWLSFESSHESVWDTNNPTFFNDKSYAEAQNTGLDGSHVVELVEAPTKVVVSAEEADFLSGVSHDTCVSAAAQIRAHFNKNTWSKVCEDRLMRAYVNGWTVKREPKYYVKVPGRFAGGYRFYCKLHEEFSETAQLLDGDPRFMLTIAEIKHYGLQDCERVEVTDDEQ